MLRMEIKHAPSSLHILLYVITSIVTLYLADVIENRRWPLTVVCQPGSIFINRETLQGASAREMHNLYAHFYTDFAIVTVLLLIGLLLLWRLLKNAAYSGPLKYLRHVSLITVVGGMIFYVLGEALYLQCLT